MGNIPIGVICDATCVTVGGIAGFFIGKHIPERVKELLSMAFALAAMAMGIVGIIKMNSMPAVIISLLLGSIIGALCGFEHIIRRCGEWIGHKFAFGVPVDQSKRGQVLELFTIAVILFCTGTTGIYGSMEAAMTGDHSILFAKASLDLFTGMIFAANAGLGIALLGIPMFIVFGTVFYTSSFIVPYVTPGMFSDFSSLGGLLIFATGLRMAEIKVFHVADMLPALVLVMPISYLWKLLPF